MYYYCIIFYVEYSVYVYVFDACHSSERLLCMMYVYLSENWFTRTSSMIQELTTIEGHRPATQSSQELQFQELRSNWDHKETVRLAQPPFLPPLLGLVEYRHMFVACVADAGLHVDEYLEPLPAVLRVVEKDLGEIELLGVE